MRKISIIHLLKFNLHPKVPCGKPNVAVASGDVKEVTCLSCRRTKIYNEAVAKAKQE